MNEQNLNIKYNITEFPSTSTDFELFCEAISKNMEKKFSISLHPQNIENLISNSMGMSSSSELKTKLNQMNDAIEAQKEKMSKVIDYSKLMRTIRSKEKEFTEFMSSYFDNNEENFSTFFNLFIKGNESELYNAITVSPSDLSICINKIIDDKINSIDSQLILDLHLSFLRELLIDAELYTPIGDNSENEPLAIAKELASKLIHEVIQTHYLSFENAKIKNPPNDYLVNIFHDSRKMPYFILSRKIHPQRMKIIEMYQSEINKLADKLP